MSTLRRQIIPIGTLVLIGSLAFVHLMALPAFEDEGSQLRWISRLIEAGEWQLPLAEGKPLEDWPMVPLFLACSPPLAAIRALHVLIGIVGAVLVYRLALQVADRWTAWVAGALFALCPFVVYLQRIALSDILLCTAGVWVLIGVLNLTGSPTWRRAGELAVALVVAACCKLPVGFVFIMALPLALALMPAGQRQPLLQGVSGKQLSTALLPVHLLALALLIVAAIRWRRGQDPGFGLADLFGIALGGYANLGTVLPEPHLIPELTVQLSTPVAVIALLGVGAAAFLGDWRQRWLITVGAVPLLGIGLLVEFWFSRYLLFTLPPLIVAAVCGWRSLGLRAGRLGPACALGALGVVAALMARQSAQLIVDPLSANWSPLDRYQYLEGPGSGYGYPQAAAFILAAPDAPPAIYSLDGHSAYQLLTYLPTGWRQRVSPIFYGGDGKALRTERERLENLLTHTPAWIVISRQLLPRYLATSFGEGNASQLSLRQIALFAKPGSTAQLAIYEVTGSQRPPT